MGNVEAASDDGRRIYESNHAFGYAERVSGEGKQVTNDKAGKVSVCRGWRKRLGMSEAVANG